MKCIQRNFLAAVLAATLVAPAGAASLLPPQNGDLVAPKALDATVSNKRGVVLESAPLQFSWALDPTVAVEPSQPALLESKGYWLDVDAADLRKGVRIDTSAPGAVVHLSPIAGAAALRVEALQLMQDGAAIPVSARFERSADSVALKSAGMAVQDGSVIVQLATGLGEGEVELKSTAARGQYLLQVFEPSSEVVLEAKADRVAAFAGGGVAVSVALQDGQDALAFEARGQLVGPDGEAIALPLVRLSDGSLEGRVALPENAGDGGALWELQVFGGGLRDGRTVQRDIRVPVAVARPTAALAGGLVFNPVTLRAEVGVNAASFGRYELRAVLFATAPDGVARPVSAAHGAALLPAGTGTLTLSFDRAHLPAGYGAPFELRELALKDQGRMGDLETRALAYRSEGAARVRSAAPIPGPAPRLPRGASVRER